jgi:hypothetical protein
MTGDLFTAVGICKACHRVFVVDECYPCYKARLEREKEAAEEVLRAAEVDCPTHERPPCRDCKSNARLIFDARVKAYVCPVCGNIRG